MTSLFLCIIIILLELPLGLVLLYEEFVGYIYYDDPMYWLINLAETCMMLNIPIGLIGWIVQTITYLYAIYIWLLTSKFERESGFVL